MMRTILTGAFMICRFAVLSLLVASFAVADPSTKPLSPPLPKPGPVEVPTKLPTTKPAQKPVANKATTKTAEKGVPSAAELIRQMKAQNDAESKLTQVAHFDLDQPVVERAPAFSLFGDGNVLTIHNLIVRLHQARDDKKLRGVLITLGNTGFSFSQAQEIRSALDELRKAGKRTFIYSDAYDTASYSAATGATDICLLGGGEMMMPGVGIETMFYKGLFEKVGVNADYVQIGEYKGAEEPYTRSAPSDELRGELNKLVDSLYNQIVDGIATHRNLSKENVKASIDEAIITGKTAKERRLVDHLVDQDGLRALIKEELGHEINLIHDYGVAKHEPLDLSSPLALFQLISKKPEASDKPSIALIHAQGTIVDGSAEDGLFGGGENIGGDNLRKAFRMAVRDDNIKAIVLRIDSPGGSALASEVMWQAARHAAESKPLIVSIGGMAASGGYYLASAGDYIFADASAIIGSIGVVGGKFVTKDLFAKVGLTTEAFTRGRNADLFSSNQPFTDRQRRMVTNWMRETYEQFTERVMTNRAGKIKDIDAVARGRIFIAKQAKELGMVDELGGIEDAIQHAAKETGLKSGEYEVRSVPSPRSLADIFGGGVDGPDAAMPFQPKIQLSLDSMLNTLSPSLRHLVTQQLQMAQLLQKRPVILAAPFVITIK
jgi:protease-4